MDNLQGIRCVASAESNKSTLNKLNGWCKDVGDWQNTTRDEGFCFGTTKGTYTSDAHDGLPDNAPMLWGHDKDCTWKAGDNIRVAVHVTAQHSRLSTSALLTSRSATRTTSMLRTRRWRTGSARRSVCTLPSPSITNR